MAGSTTLEDLIGIEHCKLGFYQELQQKVAQLRKSNLQLDEKRKENQALLDGITDMMIVISEDLLVQRVNHVFYKWYPGVDPVGMLCHRVLRNSNDRCDNCPALAALDRDEVVKDLCIYKVNGKYRHYEIIASPLKTDVGSERQVLVFKRDVTLEKEYQAQFYQAEKMATVGTLAAGVAHEINNPLAAISGFAEGLRRRIKKIEGQVDGELGAEFKEYTDTIINECLRCRDIVQTLLTFSRPIATSLSPVDINGCISDTLFILKHHFKREPSITIKTALAESIPLIRGDESQLKQVIINLLTNAYDAIGQGGTIRISTHPTSRNGVELVIEDTGCGIPLEEQDKLFEPFYTTKPVGKGVGIGLSTCYAIVRRHDGEINVDSALGMGSAFRVTLPGVND
jgi:signal transduction histidine kinase